MQPFFRDDWKPRDGFDMSQFQARPAVQTQPRRGGGFQPSALISEGSGLGGALAGGALGAAAGSVVPVVGTAIGGLLGAGIGGFLGGTGGSAVEQKVRDDRVDVGKALKEGTLEGVFSAGPLKLGRVAYQGGKALVKGAGKEGAQEAAQTAAARPGLLARGGATLRGEARGVGVGEKLSGARIGPERVKEINNFLEKTVKIGGGSAAKQLEVLEPFIRTQSSQLSEAIARSNRKLTAADKKNIVDTFQSNFTGDIIGVTPRQQSIATDLATRVRQARDIKSLDDLRKIVDDNINFARNAASPEPAAEQVYKMFRRVLTDDVANKVGAAKSLKSNLAKAFEAEELLLNRTAKPGSGISPAGITLPGRAAQSLQSMGGGALGRTGRALESRGPLATGTRVVAGSTLAGGTPQAPTGDLEGALMGGQESVQDTGGGFGADQFGGEQTSQSPYSREALISDIQRDPANAADYIAYYQELADIFAPTGGDLNVTKPTSAAFVSAQSGLQSLQQLENIMANDPGVLQRTATPGRGVNALGIGSVVRNVTDTADFDQAAFNAVENLLRIKTGAAAPEQEVRRYMSQYLPQPGDNPATVRQKLDSLYSQFGSILNLAGGQNTPTTIEDVMTSRTY